MTPQCELCKLLGYETVSLARRIEFTKNGYSMILCKDCHKRFIEALQAENLVFWNNDALAAHFKKRMHEMEALNALNESEENNKIEESRHKEDFMNINYVSTRNEKDYVSPSLGILKGIAADGGLYVPEKVPTLTKSLEELCELNYQDSAFEILKLFYTDFTEDELKYCIKNAYDDKFDTKIIAPIAKVEDDFFLELFHGKTIAFKDMALSILPYLMTVSAKKNDIKDDIIILTATSGDTGIAALEGFKNVPNTKVVVFYPKDGVSQVQEKQMITIDGDNTFVISVNGNFDDAQSAVKNIFMNDEMKNDLKNKGYVLSSANSINIGRLFPQVVYYFHAYASLVKSKEINCGDKINFTVPTGNFGNILAGYYAKLLGLPVNKFICASNENKVLYDFFKTGIYDRNRDFKLTISPSMDILISSNFERLIYLMSDQETTRNLFEDLKTKGEYTFNKEFKDFTGEFVTDKETKGFIKDVYNKGYVMDTHTAVAYGAYKKYQKESSDNHKNVILSTASPYKFAEAVCGAIDENNSKINSFELFDVLKNYSSVNIPKAVDNLENREVTQKINCDIDEMENAIKDLFSIE